MTSPPLTDSACPVIERACSLHSHSAMAATSSGAIRRPWGLLAVIYAMTSIFTAAMTNNAAAVLMFPISIAVATEQALNPMPFVVAITIAASCEFSTPIGYQTNLMVMGPGGYKWLDYTRFGGPLTIVCGIMCVLIAPRVFGGF